MLRSRSRLLLPLALSVVAPACGDPTPEGPPHVESLPVLSATREARIGDADDPDVGFSRLVGVAVAEDGTLFVGEAQVPEIRVLSPAGEVLGRIGRRGQGPGEFEQLPRFGVVGDTVWTLEGFNGRLTLFHRDGSVLHTATTGRVRVPLPGRSGHVIPWEMRPGGYFTSHFGLITYSQDEQPAGADPDSIPWPLVRFDLDGAVLDTVAWVSRPPPGMWVPAAEAPPEPRTIEIGGRPRFIPQPRRNLPQWLALDDGYILVETPPADGSGEGTIVLTRVTAPADTVYRRELHYTALPYTSADLDSIAARAARGEAGGMAPYMPGQPAPDDWEAIANRLRAEMDFPEFQPGLEYAWLAGDGAVWLKMAPDRSLADHRWVIVGPDGSVRGRVQLPAGLRPWWARGEVLWAALADELEVPWLVRYRVAPGA